MKKNSTFLTLLISTCFCSYAQVNYSFTAATATYVPVSGGTTPALINRPFNFGQYSYTYDEGVANNIPLGFTFIYNDSAYTKIHVCANGFATFGLPFITDENTVENFFINTLNLGPLQFINNNCPGDSLQELGGNTKPVLAPLWDDLNLQQDANLRYKTTGSTGSRVFTFEWANAQWQFDASGNTLSFELKLYEGSNIIEFCYHDEGGAPSNPSASIGITATGNGNFISLQNTSGSPTIKAGVENSNLNTKPANNQVYRFTPLTCAPPLAVHYTTYNNTTVNFEWTAPAAVTNFEYAVTASPDDPASGTTTSSTVASASSLAPATWYYIHVRSVCSGSSKSAWSAVPFLTTKNTSPPPAISWQKSLGGSDNDGFSGIIQTSDGGYIIAGYSFSADGDITANHGNEDVWIVKLNSSGIIEWQKTYGGSSYDAVTGIDTTLDGGYVFSAITQSNDGDVSGNHGLEDYWIVKINGSGNIQWQKCFGGSDYDDAMSVKHTPDGGFIAAGTLLSTDGDVTGSHGSVEGWVIKLSSNGSLQWQRAVGGSANDYLLSVITTNDGGYIASGSSDSEDGDVNSSFEGTECWMVKLNSSGAVQWQKTLGGSSYEESTAMRQTADGGYILVAYSYSTDGDVIFHYGNSCYGDEWIVKLDSARNIQWQKILGGKGNETPASVEQTSDGGYIIAGQSVLFVNQGTAPYSDADVNGNHGDLDCWVVKLGANGAFQWQKNLGGTSYDYSSAIKMTTDHGYILAGSSASNDGDVSGNHGSQDAWVVKLGPDVLLPTTLLDFTGEAKGKENFLHWVTVNEMNSSGFEVQRSDNGTDFKGIGFVESKAVNGYSISKLKYDFTDMGFTSNPSYYRLKQIDKDGKFSYSNIVVLRNTNVGNDFVAIYPNPVTNILNVKIVSSANKQVKLLVTDVSGKLLQNKTTRVGNAETIVQLDVSNLPSGTYFLKIICDEGCENGVKKFVKE